MDAVAALHSFWWDSPKLDDLTWLRPLNNEAYKSSAQQYAAVWPGFVERYARSSAGSRARRGFALSRVRRGPV